MQNQEHETNQLKQMIEEMIEKIGGMTKALDQQNNLINNLKEQLHQLDKENRDLKLSTEHLINARLEEQKHTKHIYWVREKKFNDYSEAEFEVQQNGGEIEAQRIITMPKQPVHLAGQDDI